MTPGQSNLLAFIKRYQADHGGASPSFDEMSAGIGIKGKAPIYDRLQALEADGYISRIPNRARCITVLPQRADLSAISDEDIAAEFRRRFVQAGSAAA